MRNEPYISRRLTPPGGFTAGIEGPACDAHGSLYAVNYAREGTIGRVSPDGVCDLFVELPPGSIGNGIRFTSAGMMLLADYTGHNLLAVDMQTRAVSVFAHEPRMNQPNDLAISAGDRIFASDPHWGDSTGQLWRIDPDGRVTRLEAGMGTTNGIEVSPNEQTLYVNETVQRTIWAYDLAADGSIANKRLLHRFDDYAMDGMRCDVDGNLYVTRWGKGTVVKLSPAGELLREIPVSGAKCTNLTFGGADGCTCYVTIADDGTIDRFRVERPGRCWQLLRRA
jgi:sugar lactone lactonase YvrE